MLKSKEVNTVLDMVVALVDLLQHIFDEPQHFFQIRFLLQNVLNRGIPLDVDADIRRQNFQRLRRPSKFFTLGVVHLAEKVFPLLLIQELVVTVKLLEAQPFKGVVLPPLGVQQRHIPCRVI